MEFEAPLCLDEKTNFFVDWVELRSQSLLPGGFGERRLQLWPQLLGVTGSEPTLLQETNDAIHPDERQIRLDTDRSFIMYAGEHSENKENLQGKLYDLLVSLFRKRPQLSYFQGYHDIVTVLSLTLPPEVQFFCVEKLSLHRLRDYMGSSLEPVLGLLRVTKNLLRLVDPGFADALERTSPLPFYALSNLLTLFSHDMPTLPLIQHVFDYILCRPPIFVVYLATSVILSRRADILRLDAGDDDNGDVGISHSLLSSLPPIVDANAFGAQEKPQITECVDVKSVSEQEYSELVAADVEADEEEPYQKPNGLHFSDRIDQVEQNEPLTIIEVEYSEVTFEEPSSRLTTLSFNPSSRPPKSPILLTSLLAQADDLHTLYPSTHPDLCLSTIMGPKSVVYTWSESFSALPDDDEAEAMVSYPALVVYPHTDGEQELLTGSDVEEDESEKRVNMKKRFMIIKRRLSLKRHKGTMVTGMVLVIAVAVAAYSVRMTGVHMGARMYELRLRDGLGALFDQSHSVQKFRNCELRQLSGWFVGVTEKVFSGRQDG